ncbi:MAG: hypothetical protein D6729_03660, partial [Deltaproteobacteria bacterium]
MLLRHVAAEVGAAFTEADVPHLWMKGLYLAAWCYPQAHLRPMEDLDLLVPIGARSEALAVLGRLGFRGAADPATVSHELALGRQGVIVDLHWHLARPGRIPSAFEAGMLARRRHTGPLSVPDPLDAAAVALAHPALTEHVSGRLLRVLDLHHLLAAMAGREAELAARLRRYQLSTAAWAQV